VLVPARPESVPLHAVSCATVSVRGRPAKWLKNKIPKFHSSHKDEKIGTSILFGRHLFRENRTTCDFYRLTFKFEIPTDAKSSSTPGAASVDRS
jgi:hypothetical protein